MCVCIYIYIYLYIYLTLCNIHIIFCQLNPSNAGREVVLHAFNPSTREAEAGGFLSSRPAWSTKWVVGQPGLHRETLSREKKKKKSPKNARLNLRQFVNFQKDDHFHYKPEHNNAMFPCGRKLPKKGLLLFPAKTQELEIIVLFCFEKLNRK